MFTNLYYSDELTIYPLVFAPITEKQDILVVAPKFLKDVEPYLRNNLFDNLSGGSSYISTTTFNEFIVIIFFVKSKLLDAGRRGLHLGCGFAIPKRLIKKFWSRELFVEIMSTYEEFFSIKSLLQDDADDAIKWFDSEDICDTKNAKISEFVSQFMESQAQKVKGWRRLTFWKNNTNHSGIYERLLRKTAYKVKFTFDTSSKILVAPDLHNVEDFATCIFGMLSRLISKRRYRNKILLSNEKLSNIPITFFSSDTRILCRELPESLSGVKKTTSTKFCETTIIQLKY